MHLTVATSFHIFTPPPVRDPRGFHGTAEGYTSRHSSREMAILSPVSPGMFDGLLLLFYINE